MFALRGWASILFRLGPASGHVRRQKYGEDETKAFDQALKAPLFRRKCGSGGIVFPRVASSAVTPVGYELLLAEISSSSYGVSIVRYRQPFLDGAFIYVYIEVTKDGDDTLVSFDVESLYSNILLGLEAIRY